jgi:hypothetical protein
MGILTKKHKQRDWAVNTGDLSEKKHGCGGSSRSSGGSFDAEPRDEKVTLCRDVCLNRTLIVTVQYH